MINTGTTDNSGHVSLHQLITNRLREHRLQRGMHDPDRIRSQARLSTLAKNLRTRAGVRDRNRTTPSAGPIWTRTAYEWFVQVAGLSRARATVSSQVIGVCPHSP
jgi:hypothetical protein